MLVELDEFEVELDPELTLVELEVELLVEFEVLLDVLLLGGGVLPDPDPEPDPVPVEPPPGVIVSTVPLKQMV